MDQSVSTMMAVSGNYNGEVSEKAFSRRVEYNHGYRRFDANKQSLSQLNFNGDATEKLSPRSVQCNNRTFRNGTHYEEYCRKVDGIKMSFSQILPRLSLSSSEPDLVEPSLSLKNELIQYLEGVYRNLSVYEHYGSKSISQLIGLSVRYALWTSPTSMLNDFNAMKCYCLWLSPTWLIDSVFDSHPDLCTELDRDYVMGIVDDTSKSDKNINTNPSLLVSCALDCFKEVYAIYMDGIKDYVKARPLVYEKYKRATLQYLETLTNHSNPKNLKEYEAWRLKGGGIPCVIWQISLYTGLEFESDSLLRSISLIVSYHNDIISINRDLQNDTPNLVVMLKEKMMEPIEAYYEAIVIVNNLYNEVRENIKEVTSDTKTICESVVVGSHFWANTEPRYAVGVKILKEALEKNMNSKRFNELTKNKEHAPGDPKA